MALLARAHTEIRAERLNIYVMKNISNGKIDQFIIIINGPA